MKMSNRKLVDRILHIVLLNFNGAFIMLNSNSTNLTINFYPTPKGIYLKHGRAAKTSAIQLSLVWNYIISIYIFELFRPCHAVTDPFGLPIFIVFKTAG